MWLYWLVAGAGAAVGVYLLGRFFGKKDRKAAWYDWLAAAILYAYWVFVFYFVLMSLAERQSKPAIVGFIIFGGLGLILIVAYRLLLARRLGKAHA